MKKQLLTAAAVLLSVCGYAQTKGTSTLGLGFGSFTQKSQYTSQDEVERKASSVGLILGYGYFIEDNVRLGLDLDFNRSKQEYTADESSDNKSNTKGIALSYQRYYPLIGKFYAYAGGKGSYSHYKQEQLAPAGTTSLDFTTEGDNYGLSAFGGLSWFVSKRWALETQLLSAGASYTTSSTTNQGGFERSDKQTNFGLSSGGLFNNTSFKIYFLF